MSDILMNYFVVPSVVSMVGFMALVVIHPVLAKKVAKEISWQSVRMFSQANIFMERLADKYAERYESSSSESEDSPDETKLSYFDTKQNIMIEVGTDHNDISKEWWENNKDDIGFFMLTDDNDLMKISHNYHSLVDSDDWTTIEKPFVQVELVQKESTLDIHDKLNYFYVSDNVILDKSFLKWYVGHFFDTELEEDYILKIFDKDVNLFEMNSEQMVKLSKDGYKVMDFQECQKCNVEDEEKDEEKTEENTDKNDDDDSEDEEQDSSSTDNDEKED